MLLDSSQFWKVPDMLRSTDQVKELDCRQGVRDLRNFDLYTFVTSFPSACLRTQVLTMCRFTVLSLRVLRERVRL